MKHYLCIRTTFNSQIGHKGDYETDVITLSEEKYNEITSTPQYQSDLRDKSKPTTLELKIEKEFPDHEAIRKYTLELKNKKAAPIETTETPGAYTEKGLKKLKRPELEAILIDNYGGEITPEMTNVGHVIDAILTAQNEVE